MSSASPASGAGAAHAPVQTPDDSELPANEVTLAPTGRLRGDAAEMLCAIARARITPSAKDVLLLIYAATYSPTNGTGWVAFTMRDLANYFETWPHDIRDRLLELMDAHIIHRPPTVRGKRSIVCLRPVSSWSPHVFDFAAARKRHARPNPGVPPVVRPAAPHTPLDQRGGADIRDRAFTLQETVEAHARERGADEAGVKAHWEVVERFQSITDQAFKPEFLDQLTEMLATYSAAAIISTLSRNQSTHAPRNPWGYLRRCFENAPKPKSSQEATRDDQFSTPAQDGRGRGAGSRDASHASHAAEPVVSEQAAALAARTVDLDALTDEEFAARFGTPEQLAEMARQLGLKGSVADGASAERSGADATKR